MKETTTAKKLVVRDRRWLAQGLSVTVGVVGLATGASFVFLGHDLADIVMLYLLGIVVMAVQYGYAASLLAGALSVAAVDFFFTPPYFSFAVADRHLVFTFFIMLTVAFIISSVAEAARRSEARAREREREAQLERLRNAVLSSVSHDLRTPLALMKGAATAILDGGDRISAVRRHDYLRTISDEANRLNRLVRKLLDMTSLEADMLRINKEWQCLEEVVGVALGRLEESLRSRSVRVQIAPEATLAPFDGILLEQVLVNLVENAVRYTPPNAPIDITARRRARDIEVEVADFGPGVPEGKEEQIFDKFARASDVPGGMGVGLTICRGVMAAHGGRIWCENKPSGGASFRFVLPCDEAPPPTMPMPEALGDP
jgi:two-component system, OmpR family, sensor histidine kinase KdpD